MNKTKQLIDNSLDVYEQSLVHSTDRSIPSLSYGNDEKNKNGLWQHCHTTKLSWTVVLSYVRPDLQPSSANRISTHTDRCTILKGIGPSICPLFLFFFALNSNLATIWTDWMDTMIIHYVSKSRIVIPVKVVQGVSRAMCEGKSYMKVSLVHIAG